MRRHAPDCGSAPGKDIRGGRTILVTWVRAICRALDAAGCDSAALLAEAGFDLKSLDGPDGTLPDSPRVAPVESRGGCDRRPGLRAQGRQPHQANDLPCLELRALREFDPQGGLRARAASTAMWRATPIEYEFWRQRLGVSLRDRAGGRRPLRIGRCPGRGLPADVPLFDRARLFAAAHRVSPRAAGRMSRISRVCCARRCNSAPPGPGWCSTATPSSARSTAAIRSWRGTMMRSRLNICRRSSATTFSGGFARC